MTPRLAVVITNHNHARYVAAAIESALATGGSGVEVIVVDDGSTDHSLDVLDQYSDRVLLVTQSNGGQGSAFNAGLTAVSAPITIFLDADDLIEPDLPDRLESAFVAPGVAKVQYPLWLIDSAGGFIGGTMPSDPNRLARGDVRRQVMRFPDDLTWQPTSGNAFRTDVLRTFFPMPTDAYRICADYYVSNLAAAHGEVVVLDRPGGAYRVHSSNHHYALRATPHQLRANVLRTAVTNEHLRRHCVMIGLADQAGAREFRSVTALGHRLVSWRLDPALHPLPPESLSRLTLRGLQAAFGRFDVGPVRRAAMAAWFLATALVPRRWLPNAAAPLVRLDLPPGVR